jgi:hypothetical protein
MTPSAIYRAVGGIPPKTRDTMLADLVAQGKISLRAPNPKKLGGRPSPVYVATDENDGDE